MRTNHIKALTGVRFFAAFWVVTYHVTRANKELLQTHFPNLDDLTRPLLGQGNRGVDLFFILSGFVLALNYLDQLGPRFDLSRAARFLWLRLARVWPLYVTVMLIAGVLIVVRHLAWDSVPTARVNGSAFFQQLLMVQLWFDTKSWSGPAWSLSAEWLAYLLCPLLSLVVFRLHHQLRARSLFLAAIVAMLPCLIIVMSHSNFVVPNGWAVRIVCEFTAGMLLCAAISRLQISHRMRLGAGVLAIVLVIGLVGYYYLVFGRPGWSWTTLPASIIVFPALISALAIGSGPLTAFLSTRVMVLGGQISYALYLVHSPLLHFSRDVLIEEVGLKRVPLRLYLEVGVVPVIVLFSWVLFRFVEEPARKAMRRMLDPFPSTTKPLVTPGES